MTNRRRMTQQERQNVSETNQQLAEAAAQHSTVRDRMDELVANLHDDGVVWRELADALGHRTDSQARKHYRRHETQKSQARP